MCSLQLSSEKPGLIPTPNNSKLIYYMPPNIKIPLVSTVAMALAMAPLSRADCRDNKSCPPATELGMGAPCEGGSWYLVASQWSPPPSVIATNSPVITPPTDALNRRT
jgi:hypothetical protein